MYAYNDVCFPVIFAKIIFLWIELIGTDDSFVFYQMTLIRVSTCCCPPPLTGHLPRDRLRSVHWKVSLYCLAARLGVISVTSDVFSRLQQCCRVMFVDVTCCLAKLALNNNNNNNNIVAGDIVLCWWPEPFIHIVANILALITYDGFSLPKCGCCPSGKLVPGCDIYSEVPATGILCTDSQQLQP